MTQAPNGPPTEARSGGAEPQPAAREGEPPQGDVARSVVALVEFSGLKNWQDMRPS